MVGICSIEECRKKFGMNRERAREISFLGPTTTGTTLLLTREFKMEEPEVLLEIDVRFEGGSLVTSTSDNNFDQAITVKDNSARITQTSEETGATGVKGTTSSELVYATFQMRQSQAFDTAVAISNSQSLRSQFKKWDTWAYLLEEDDILQVRLDATITVTQVNFASVLVSVKTMIAPPKDSLRILK